MKKKYDKYWGTIENVNTLLLIAIVLDPRYKLDYVTFFIGEMHGETKAEEVAKGIKGLISCLYEFYLRYSHGIANNQVSNDALWLVWLMWKRKMEIKIFVMQCY